MHQEVATVLWNFQENSMYYRIGLACGSEYRNAIPGQFVTLRIPESMTPLLRRPFSIHKLITDNRSVKGIEILYKTIGGFTQKLSDQKKGDHIDVLGPLGHGFSISGSYKKVALIAGGIGVAPLVFLSDMLHEKGINLSDSVACIGGRSKYDVLCRKNFKDRNMIVKTTTEDGTEGEKGLITNLFQKWLKTNTPDIIYSCGPMPMLSAVANIANNYNLQCEVSIETIMACGLGACMGCAVETNEDTGHYRHVCKNGPVFDATT